MEQADQRPEHTRRHEAQTQPGGNDSQSLARHDLAAAAIKHRTGDTDRSLGQRLPAGLAGADASQWPSKNEACGIRNI